MRTGYLFEKPHACGGGVETVAATCPVIATTTTDKDSDNDTDDHHDEEEEDKERELSELQCSLSVTVTVLSLSLLTAKHIHKHSNMLTLCVHQMMIECAWELGLSLGLLVAAVGAVIAYRYVMQTKTKRKRIENETNLHFIIFRTDEEAATGEATTRTQEAFNWMNNSTVVLPCWQLGYWVVRKQNTRVEMNLL